MNYAPSTWKRIFAFGIDQLLQFLIFAAAWLSFTVVSFDIESWSIPGWSYFVLYVLWPFCYDVLFLSLLKATPGQWMFNLQVVPSHRDDLHLSFAQIFLRALAARTTVFFSWAPYVTAFFRYDRTHVIDWLAETRVVQDHARSQKPKLRIFLGLFLVWIFLSEGLEQSPDFIRQIFSDQVQWSLSMDSNFEITVDDSQED
ncbi:MAG: RDD family protein [Pseudobdellovibrionaceae bacterium]